MLNENVKAVILDLGGVLINTDPMDYLRSIFPEQEELCQLICDELAQDPLWAQLDTATVETFAEGVPQLIQRHPEHEDEYTKFFALGWMEQIYHPLDHGMALLEEIREKNLPYYLLTNYSMEGFAFLERYDFIRNANGAVVSAHERLAKPDHRIYEILLERYHLNAEVCCFYDDNDVNVKAAQECGIPAIQMKGKSQPLY